MMKTKTVSLLVMSALLATGLAACGESEEQRRERVQEEARERATEELARQLGNRELAEQVINNGIAAQQSGEAQQMTAAFMQGMLAAAVQSSANSTGVTATVTALDPNAAPSAGRRTHALGDAPLVLSTQVEGALDASEAVDMSCAGYVSRTPTLELTLSRADQGRLYLSAWSEADLTLVVQAPDGLWHCNDDAWDGLNPGVAFDAPATGRYRIWVGRYNLDEQAPSSRVFVSNQRFGAE